MKKQIISSVLCAAMCLTAVPSAAYAAFAPDITEGISIEANVGADVAPNTLVQLTDNIKGIYDGFGTLTITGSGEYYVSSQDYCKFVNNIHTEIKKLVIKNVGKNEVFTSIKPGAFDDLDFEELELPDTITALPDRCLYTSNDLIKFKIPSNVKSIGNAAFYADVLLKEIVIPDAVESIGSEAFSACYGLEKVQLSDNITEIPYFCFGNSNLKTVNFPKKLKVIGDRAFTNTHLAKVELPQGVTTIGPDSFSGINELKTATVPSSVTLIDSYAFSSNNVEDIYVYSKNCEFADYDGRFSYNLGQPATSKSAGTLIHCYANSTAHKYAMKYGYRFELMDKPTDLVYGDANLDGKVTLGDALAVSQYIANEEKYGLSETAKKNADCYNPGDGITGNDASAIQRLISGDIEELPYIAKDQD